MILHSRRGETSIVGRAVEQPNGDGTDWVDDLYAAMLRVEEAGGRRSSDQEVVPGRGSIVVMTDPEGHEFCLISADRP